ncbi:hypothetical protein HYPSUDRAFT_208694 [Hypholoma sublateritium FD-334 SS-4]|uniref:Uncharacterized protein n=1 Tax=Hypholoma sublateritium (strain FD-334 SS-4) TaxID=945553 RepID=A0A0D2P1F5_HYPSF|nr:hypothetical protein HYPSUDRAFT_208694 [Hypholoma sublateritium FD-334 SS-4]
MHARPTLPSVAQRATSPPDVRNPNLADAPFPGIDRNMELPLASVDEPVVVGGRLMYRAFREVPPTAAVDAQGRLPVIAHRVNDLPPGLPPQMNRQHPLGPLGATIYAPGTRRTPQRARGAPLARTTPGRLSVRAAMLRYAARRPGNGFRGADADWLAALRAPISPNVVPRAARMRDARMSRRVKLIAPTQPQRCRAHAQQGRGAGWVRL